MTEPHEQVPWEFLLKEDLPNVRPSSLGSWKLKCTSGISAYSGNISIASDWQENVPGLVTGLAVEIHSRWRESIRLESIERELMLVNKRVADLEQAKPTIVLIDTMAPEPLDMIKPFHVNVEAVEDEYQASFLDANLSALGDSKSEAIWNLKDRIAATFKSLCRIGEDKLGMGPARQLGILKTFIRNQT